MKKNILLFIALIPILLMAVTRTVSLDGTQQYTSIQTAIDACSYGDTVQVHPGEYFEHLNTGGRSITITSLYHITQSEATIDSTIIHAAVPNSCLVVSSTESVTINGFTMMNNYPVNLGVFLSGIGHYAGGIHVTNSSSIQILNCVIKNCIGSSAGGVYFEGLNFYMSNTKIYENYGGGIFIYGADANSIIFDAQNLNSIYNNYNSDLNIAYWEQPLHISLYTFSIMLTVPDYYYFTTFESATITITVQNAYFTLINHDLYVSPTGNNANDGLTPNSPLQTIAYAVKIIESDSLNPKTIHLAPGIYNFSESNQYFPFTLKSHIRLIGDNVNNTTFDSQQTIRWYIGISRKVDIRIENLTFSPYSSQSCSIGVERSEGITFRNLRFDGNFIAPRIQMVYANDVICENIEITNSSVANDNYAFRVSYCDNLKFNNIIIDNLDITDWMSNVIGFSFMEADATIRNSIISNCEGYDVSVLFYQNIESAQSDYTIDLSNLLIINNQSTNSNLWSMAPVYLSNRYQRMKMNNCTIANNNGTHTNVVRVNGDCDINNTILYNPGNYSDIYFFNVYEGYDENENLITYTHHPTINYSLVKQPYTATNPALLTSDNVMQNIDPLFMGSIYDSLIVYQPEYYKLYSGSPCINAGTPDTLGLNISPMDLAGNYRVWNNRIDMGCFEYGSEHYVANEDPEYPTLSDRISLSTYPNPVYLNSAKGAYCFIDFTLPEKAKESPGIEIYNLKGQKVRTIKDNYELRIMNYELACNTGTLACKSKLTSTRHVLTDKIETDKSVCSTTTGKGACVTGLDKRGAYPTSYSTVFDCRDEHSQRLASGIYIVKVTSGKHQKAMKMTILK